MESSNFFVLTAPDLLSRCDWLSRSSFHLAAPNMIPCSSPSSPSNPSLVQASSTTVRLGSIRSYLHQARLLNLCGSTRMHPSRGSFTLNGEDGYPGRQIPYRHQQTWQSSCSSWPVWASSRLCLDALFPIVEVYCFFTRRDRCTRPTHLDARVSRRR